MPERDVTHLLISGMPKENFDLLRSVGRIADAREVGAFVVGGVVRDLLLGIENYDLDVVVEEPAPSFADEAARVLGGSVKAHTRFGTAILVLPGGMKIDLATARSEAYERPGALPAVSAGTILEDLKRRDFTINSMAVRLNAHGFGTLLDHYGGEADLRAGCLRVLTDRSFEDDPTRILRGVRFAARFSQRFEERAERLLHEAVAGGALSTVSGERIMNEITLILREPNPWPPVERMIAWGILRAIHADWSPTPALGTTFAEIGKLLREETAAAESGEAEPWLVYFAAAIETVPARARDRILDRLNVGRRLHDTARAIERLEEKSAALEAADEISRSEVHRALAGLSTEALLLGMATSPRSRRAGRIALYLSELVHTTTSLTGRDLVDLGLEEGPLVGRVLAALLGARLDGIVASEEEERALAARLVRELDADHKS